MWKHKTKWLVRGGRKVRCYLCGKKILAKGDLFLFHQDTGYYSHQSCMTESTTISGNERRRAVKKIAVGAAVVGAIAAGAGKLIDISSQSKGSSNSPDTQTILTSQGLILPALTSDPANPVPGQMWYRSDQGATAHFNGIQNRVVYSTEINDGNVHVTSKGIVNGLSVLPNDGTGWFGPDTTKGATAPGQYGGTYTETNGLQEAGNYGAINKIQKIQITPGVYTIDTPITASPSSGTDWSLITFEGESSIINILSGNNPSINNMAVIMPSSSFSGTSLITNNYISASNTFRDIAFNLNGLAINGIKFQSGSGTTLTSELQATENFFNLSFWNGSGGSSNAYVYQADSSTYNYILQNCTFSGSEYSVYLNNTGSVNWLINSQDYTTYGLYDNATQLNITGGVYQGIGTGNNAIIWIWGASFSNAYVNPVFNIDSNNTTIKIYSSYIAIPTSGSVFKLYTDNTNISVHDTSFAYYTTPVGSLFSGGFTLSSLDWKNNTYEGGSGVFPAASDLDGYSISYTSLTTTVNELSLVVIEPIVTTPSVPASGTAQKNTNPYAVDVYVYGGDVTKIQITKGGTAYTVFSVSTAIAMSGQHFPLNSTDSITITYSTAPTWEWL